MDLSKLKKMFACAVVMIALAAISAVSAFGQEQPSLPPITAEPTLPSQPIPPVFQRPLNCVGDALYVAEWNTGNVNLICRESDGQVRSGLFVYAPGTGQIFQKDGAVLFYSNSGRLVYAWNYSADPVTGMAQNVSQWRIMGGGIITGMDGNVVSLNLPWDWENHKFVLYNQANYYSEPTAASHRFPASCAATARNSWGDQFCLDASNNRILRVKNRFFVGLDFKNPEILLEGEQVVAIAGDSAAKKNNLYVLLAPGYDCVTMSGGGMCQITKPGRLVEVAFDPNGQASYTELVSGISTNLGRGQFLAVGREGVYFPVSQGEKGWGIMKYDFVVRAASVFLDAGSGFASTPFFGALAVRKQQ